MFRLFSPAGKNKNLGGAKIIFLFLLLHVVVASSDETGHGVVSSIITTIHASNEEMQAYR